MHNKQSIFGEIGLLAVAVIFLVVVSLSNVLLRGIRVDLTENNLYTLSDGTASILGNIQEPLNIYFFFSDQATADIPQLRTYAGRVKETLQEFSQHANGKLRITVIDPLPFSEEEDRAAQYGLQGISLGAGGDSVYLGIAATNSIGDEEIIPFLDPNKETFLEYDLARLIYTLSNPERPVVGLISGLPMTTGFDPQTQQMRQPWIVTSQIQQLFELRSLDTSTREIAEDVDVLMVVHPKNLSPQTLYAIDQFIIGGGHTLLFVDPFSETDFPMPDPANPAAAAMASRASNLDPLFSAWGISVSNEEIIADDRYALSVTGPDQRPVRHLGLIGIPAGLLLGYGIGAVLVPVVLRSTQLDAGITTISTSPVIFLGSMLFALLTVLLSCSKPGKMAAKVSPVEATKYTEVMQTKKKRRSIRGAKLHQMAFANL